MENYNAEIEQELFNSSWFKSGNQDRETVSKNITVFPVYMRSEKFIFWTRHCYICEFSGNFKTWKERQIGAETHLEMVLEAGETYKVWFDDREKQVNSS